MGSKDTPPKALTAKALRLIEASERIAAAPPQHGEIDFQHTVLCQTSLPHRPTNARTWEREQGNVSLSIEAGRVKQGRRWVDVALPHGEKPRLLLIHLHREAIRTGSPVIDVEGSMTAFIRSIGIDDNGLHVREFKDQMTRLAASSVRFAVGDERHTLQGKMQIVDAFDLWWPKDENQRVMWPTVLRLSDQYFKGLAGHAVPLDHRAIAVLKGSSLCLDIYGWLAQRLHRVPPSKAQYITWQALKEQFGPDYARMRDFRTKFLRALQAVHTVYPTAEWALMMDGLILFRSPPPVSKKLVGGHRFIATK